MNLLFVPFYKLSLVISSVLSSAFRTVSCSSSRILSSRLSALSAIRSCLILTLDSVGDVYSHIFELLNPMTDTSEGTLTPISLRAFIA